MPQGDPFSSSAAQIMAQLLQDPSSVSHFDLLRLRKSYGNDPAMQQLLAPYEHQAFAREYASQGPMQALGVAAATPVYAAAKGLGLMSGRSGSGDPLSQILAGLSGAGQGISQWWNSQGAQAPAQAPATNIIGVRG